jgi:hypothetical protein
MNVVVNYKCECELTCKLEQDGSIEEWDHLGNDTIAGRSESKFLQEVS